MDLNIHTVVNKKKMLGELKNLRGQYFRAFFYGIADNLILKVLQLIIVKRYTWLRLGVHVIRYRKHKNMRSDIPGSH